MTRDEEMVREEMRFELIKTADADLRGEWKSYPVNRRSWGSHYLLQGRETRSKYEVARGGWGGLRGCERRFLRF